MRVATILLGSRFITDTIVFAAVGDLVLATLSCNPRSLDPRGEQLGIIAMQRNIFRLTVLMGACEAVWVCGADTEAAPSGREPTAEWWALASQKLSENAALLRCANYSIRRVWRVSVSNGLLEIVLIPFERGGARSQAFKKLELRAGVQRLKGMVGIQNTVKTQNGWLLSFDLESLVAVGVRQWWRCNADA
jgi:hypothetical protein